MRFTTQILLVALAASSEAFMSPSPRVSSKVSFGLFTPTATRLFAEEEAAPGAEETVAEEAPEEAPEPEEEPEDPELVALKEEIAKLETELKGKQNTLSRVQEDAERYTKTGYARRVAEMEDMRRMRQMMQSSNKETAKASVVQKFLPVLDELRSLKELYEGDEFGQKYSGVTGSMQAALSELGVEEFTAGAGGEKVNPQRVQVVEEEYSEEIEKGSIIRPISMGMEVAGNVVRLAQCVASLGSEKAQEEEAAAAEESEPEAEAPTEE